VKNKIIVVLVLLSLLLSCGFAFAEGKWGGVDESVVERIAEEHGRKAAEPLINTDQGDLLLFVFLLAGAVGGFAAGYSWKSLTDKRAKG
jgi:ABC-type cobalt transport system substrate-binding protein